MNNFSCIFKYAAKNNKKKDLKNLIYGFVLNHGIEDFLQR